jgi:SAM-dependent methyltransferase
MKELIKRTLRHDSVLYESLRLVYGVVTRHRNTVKDAKRRLLRDGVFHDEDELWMCSLLPSELLSRVLEQLEPTSVLDVGCGTGKSLDFFLARGLDAFGIEGSSLAISRAANPHRILCANLERPIDLGRRFDLVWSFEVAEHIDGRYADNLVRTLTTHADAVVMSAAVPGQGGEGHLNEQPPQYWIERFARMRFDYDRSLTSYLRQSTDTHSQNILAFRGEGAAASR